MDNDDLEARIAAKRQKKKQQGSKKSSKKASSSSGGGTATSLLEERIRAKQQANFQQEEESAAAAAVASSAGNSIDYRDSDDDDDDGGGKPSAVERLEARLEEKKKEKMSKKKKKKRTSASNGVAADDVAAAAAAIDGWERDLQAKNDAYAAGENGRSDYGNGVARGSIAPPANDDRHASAKSQASHRSDEEDGHAGEHDNFHENGHHGNQEDGDQYMQHMLDKSEADRLDQDRSFVKPDDQNGTNFSHGVEEFYPNVEADTEVMATINQEGLVQVDETGGIQAFVAETIAIEGDDVGIIKSDAEIEKEEKKKYTKYFLGTVACLIAVIAAIVVPLTLKFAKGNQVNQLNIITEEPTSSPSLMPSAMPSSMPSSVRFTRVVQKLTPLSGNALKVQGSPQYRAAMWISDEDEMQMPLSMPGFEQRYIMALFYFAMDGPLWVNSNGWLGPESECFWFGIDGVSEGCGGENTGGCKPRGDFVGDYDKVCRIGMGYANNLYGEFPKEMGFLTEMTYVEIQGDWLHGTLPPEMGEWRKLRAFLVNNNFIGGTFPPTFGENKMLGTIFLNNNRFNGTFPQVFSTLKNLEWLEADNNTFTGEIPESICNLKSLRIFTANNNTLNGYIPDNWDENNLIEDFELEDNNIRGPLPETLANAKFLKDLRLSNNQITGSFPISYYDFESLEELYLDRNKMGGELPQTAELFYDGLQELVIYNNAFEGRFPVEHFESTLRVKKLMLHDNQMTGVISDNICDRLDPERSYTRLTDLTADCDLISCTCCTCYEDGVLVS